MQGRRLVLGCLGTAALAVAVLCTGLVGLGVWFASPGRQAPVRRLLEAADEAALVLRPTADDPGIQEAVGRFMLALGSLYEQAAATPAFPRPWQAAEPPASQPLRRPVGLGDLELAWSARTTAWALALNLPLYPRLVRLASRMGSLPITRQEGAALDWADETMVLASSAERARQAVDRLQLETEPGGDPSPLEEALDQVDAHWDLALVALEGPLLEGWLEEALPSGLRHRVQAAVGGFDLVTGDVAEYELQLRFAPPEAAEGDASAEAPAEGGARDGITGLASPLCERIVETLAHWSADATCMGAVDAGRLTLTGRATGLTRTWWLLADMTFYGPSIRRLAAAALDHP